jgi:hypothetical protein
MDDAVLKIILAVFGAIITLLAVYMAYKLTLIDKKNDECEMLRRRESVLIFTNIDAAGTLAEKTAIGVKSGKINGEIDEALKYHKDQKHALEAYLREVNAMKKVTT